MSNTTLPPAKPIVSPQFLSDEQLNQCLEIVTTTLDDMKAKNITILDVSELSDIMERIVIAEGTSNRHLRAVADKVTIQAKQAGFRPLGIEGQGTSDWTLVDLGAIVVHIMMPQAREFYDLEGLWKTQS